MVILSGFSCCVPETMNHQTVELHGTLLNRFSHKKNISSHILQEKSFLCDDVFIHVKFHEYNRTKNSILFHVIY